MLTSMRNATETWLGRVVLSIGLGLIIVSFAIWGIGNIFQGSGPSEAASVGATQVSAASFRRALETQLENLRARNMQITSAQAHAFGYDRELLLNQIADAALAEKARVLGLAVGTKQLNRLVRDDNAFRDENGAFSPNVLNHRMAEQGLTRKDLPARYTRRQIEAAMLNGTQTPKGVLEVINRFNGELRTVQYVALPAMVAGEIPKPSDGELQKFYASRKGGFRTPEFRDFALLTISRTSLAKPDQVTEADARQLYDQVADGRFGASEQRTVQELIFPTEADAKAAQARIRAGTSFEAIAKERQLSESNVNVGTKPKSQLGEIAEAAFKLPQDGVSEPVKVAFGYALVRITKIVPATLVPFDQVAAQLKTEVAASRVKPQEVDDLLKKVDLQRNAGKLLGEATKALGLKPREITGIDANGRDKQGVPVAGLTETPALLKAVFASDVNLDNEPLSLAAGGIQWFEVQKVEPVRERSFAEVKVEVEKQWRSAETQKRLAAKATEIVAKANGGASLASLVSGAEIKTADKVRRSQAGPLPAKLVTEAFTTPVGSAGSVTGDDGSTIVFKVADATLPTFDPKSPGMQSAAADFSRALSLEVLRQYASKLEDEYGVRINEGVLRMAADGTERQPLSVDPE